MKSLPFLIPDIPRIHHPKLAGIYQLEVGSSTMTPGKLPLSPSFCKRGSHPLLLGSGNNWVTVDDWDFSVSPSPWNHEAPVLLFMPPMEKMQVKDAVPITPGWPCAHSTFCLFFSQQLHLLPWHHMLLDTTIWPSPSLIIIFPIYGRHLLLTGSHSSSCLDSRWQQPPPLASPFSPSGFW